MSTSLDAQSPESDAAKRARKRYQNRLNQRARRARIRELLDMKGDTKHSFRVRRWRLNEDQCQAAHPIPSRDLARGSPVPRYGQMVERASTTWRASVLTMYGNGRFNPFADGLLHLIHENIYCALAYNKIIFHQNISELAVNDDGSPPPDPKKTCLHLSVNLPLSENMPFNLFPTQIQQTVPHSTWINAIPFPRMRDNLITWHDSFDHADFLRDLVGFLMDVGAFRKPRLQATHETTSGVASFESEEEGSERDVTFRWRGAIIWGEPHLIESWEFTAPFLRKWAWCVDGCEDAIRVSNGWRMSRGLTPLRRTPCAAKK